MKPFLVPVIVAAASLIIAATPVEGNTTPPSAWFEQVPALPACSNSALDPYTSCQCPFGESPADNGCCKKRCPTRCAVEHANLLRNADTQPAMDTCDDLRICTYMWGDPHAKYHDYKFDPQWQGWMLLSQCDGLKIFAKARGLAQRRAGITVTEEVLLRFRTTVIRVQHDFISNPARMLVFGLDASGGASGLQPIALPTAGDAVSVGKDATAVTITRLSDNKIQICTAQGDTIKITRFRNIELNTQMCLAPTCNLRATGFMGIHGAPKSNRFPLPGSMNSEGKLPDNGSPYLQEYMDAWYTETNKQLQGNFRAESPAFPRVDANRCAQREFLETNPPTTAPATTRYRVFTPTSTTRGQSEAARLCAEKGGYLATIRNQSDFEQLQRDLSGQDINTAILGGSDADNEGTFIWKYGPPYNRGRKISTGRHPDPITCLQDFCKWAPGEPNDYPPVGGEDAISLRNDFSWNDIPDGDNQPDYNWKYVCEFVPGADPQEENQNDSINNALDDAIGGDIPDDVDSATQAPNAAGSDCEAIFSECRQLGCPEVLLQDCQLANDWIATQDYNAENPDRTVDPATTEDEKEEQENAPECTDGKKYCDSCGPNGTPSCFTCTTTDCPAGQSIIANSASGTCSCSQPPTPPPECTTDDDCQSNPLSLQATGGCARVTCDAATQKCVLGVKSAGSICRRVSFPCDIAESCDGTSAQCPPDTRDTTSTGCVPATTTAEPSTTAAPPTPVPTTEAPPTPQPTTATPPTPAPTTEAPPTPAPTTEAPPTPAPTTAAPTTEAPKWKCIDPYNRCTDKWCEDNCNHAGAQFCPPDYCRRIAPTTAPPTPAPTTEAPPTPAPTTAAPPVVCSADQYKTSAGACVNLRVCELKEYESKAPTATSDRECSDRLLPTCNREDRNPFTGCQCPQGTAPADNGCCKKQCPVRCEVEHASLLRNVYSVPQTDLCDDYRACTYVWGDPHVRYGDFRFDPQWQGWMLLSQCDGLKVFSHARQVLPTRKVTVQSKLFIQYRTTIITIEHDYSFWPSAMVVRTLDSTIPGAKLTEAALPAAGSSVVVGVDAVQVNVARLDDSKIQICTANGDTITVLRHKNRALNTRLCLSQTCNQRATGFLGVHAAEKSKRFSLPGSTDSQGKVPANGSPYHKEYMQAWYAETNRQLSGTYPADAPAFPVADKDKCVANTPAAVPEVDVSENRYVVYEAAVGSLAQSEAHELCRGRGGWLASIRNQSDFAELKRNIAVQGGGSAIHRALIGANDVDEEGLFVWKYAPPYNQGRQISRGNRKAGTLECLQDKCFWNGANPDNHRNNEHVVELYSSFQWNDRPDAWGGLRKYVCEFIRPPPPPAENQNVADQQGDAVQDAIADAGLEEDQETIVDQQTGDSEDCAPVWVECRAKNCPAALLATEGTANEDCTYAIEWLAARDVNEELDQNDPARYDEDIFNDEQQEANEQAPDCRADAGEYYCDSCGQNGAAGCFTCGDLTCSEASTVLTPNAATGTCSCVVPAPAPECSVDADCETLAIASQVTPGACDRVVCEQQKCKIALKTAGSVCRRASFVCDPVEVCDGSTLACPSDVLGWSNSGTCQSLTPCTESQWQRAGPTPTSDFDCVSYTTCTADEYESKAPTATSDRECTTITTTTSAPPTPAPTTEAPPTPAPTTEAPPTPVPTTEAPPTPQPTTATPPTPQPTTAAPPVVCSADQYKTATGDCADLTICQAGQQHETTAPSATSDRVCADNTVCVEGVEFELKAAGPRCDRLCYPLTICRSDEYEFEAPTATTDRVCKPLTVCHPRKEYESKAPTATSDRECSPVRTCGSKSFEAIKPGRFNNRVCCASEVAHLRRLANAVFRIILKRKTSGKTAHEFLLQSAGSDSTSTSSADNAELVLAIQNLLNLQSDSQIQFAVTELAVVDSETGELKVSIRLFGPTEEVDAALSAASTTNTAAAAGESPSNSGEVVTVGIPKKNSFSYTTQPVTDPAEQQQQEGATAEATTSLPKSNADRNDSPAGLKSANNGGAAADEGTQNEEYYRNLFYASVVIVLILTTLVIVLLAVLFRQRKKGSHSPSQTVKDSAEVAASRGVKHDDLDEQAYNRQRRNTLDLSGSDFSHSSNSPLTGGLSPSANNTTITTTINPAAVDSVKVADLDVMNQSGASSVFSADTNFSLSTSAADDEEAVMVSHPRAAKTGGDGNPLSPL